MSVPMDQPVALIPPPLNWSDWPFPGQSDHPTRSVTVTQIIYLTPPYILADNESNLSCKM